MGHGESHALTIPEGHSRVIRIESKPVIGLVARPLRAQVCIKIGTVLQQGQLDMEPFCLVEGFLLVESVPGGYRPIRSIARGIPGTSGFAGAGSHLASRRMPSSTSLSTGLLALRNAV